jgi:hypothetical protein
VEGGGRVRHKAIVAVRIGEFAQSLHQEVR